MKQIGHMPPQENPERFNEILLRFLARPGQKASFGKELIERLSLPSVRERLYWAASCGTA